MPCLYWKQKLWGGKVNIAAGQVDVTDYLDAYGMVSPWLAFNNFAFTTNPTIAIPDPGLGLAVSAALTDNVYFVGGFADPNAKPDDPFDDFDCCGRFPRSRPPAPCPALGPPMPRLGGCGPACTSGPAGVRLGAGNVASISSSTCIST